MGNMGAIANRNIFIIFDKTLRLDWFEGIAPKLPICRKRYA
jgi:hypothetical protein